MFVFFVIPYLKMADKPLILLDLPRREFTLFGTTFLPTDTLLFMLLFVSTGIMIFLVTATSRPGLSPAAASRRCDLLSRWSPAVAERRVHLLLATV